MTAYVRYILFYLVIALLGMAYIGYVTDPLGYFRNQGLKSPGKLGNRVWGEDRLVKDMALSALHPRTVIAGTSRVRLGMNTDDPAMTRYLGPAYNLGINGASYDELNTRLLAALRKTSLRTVIIGLDINQFTRKENTKPQPILLQWLWSWDVIRMPYEMGVALWSTSTIKLARRALKKPHLLTLTGVANSDIKAKLVRERGHLNLTQGIETRIAQSERESHWRYYQQRMAMLGEFLGKACQENKDIKLFISPIHVRQLVLYHTIGKFEQFLEWKAELAALADKWRLMGCTVSLVDFSRITPYTSEQFPAYGDTTQRMRWYWESSHYTFALGLLIIQRLFGDVSAPADFGSVLTRGTVELEAKKAREELRHYMQAHPDLTGQVAVAADRGSGVHGM